MYNYVGQYLDDYETLLPADSSVPDLVNTLWYQYIKGKFNDKVWEDFYSRQIFNVMKFNNEDNDINYANIIKSIKIRLQTKSRLYERMFNAFMSDYNPLWNVDGVTGTIRESKHTGDVTNTGKSETTNTGRSETTNTGKSETTNTGKSDTTSTGKNSTTRSGSETNTPTGKDIVQNMTTTFDSDTDRDTTRTETTFDSRIDTHAYNSVKDEYQIDSANPMKESYKIDDENPLKESYQIDSQNPLKETYQIDTQNPLKQTYQIDSQNPLKEQRNLTDNDLEMVIRQGNIGVTKSSELLLDTLDLYNNELMDFVHYVVNDCINQISYSIY